MKFTGFEDLIEQAKNLREIKVAVAAAADAEVLEAIKMAQEGGFVHPILVGDQEKIYKISKNIGLDLSQTDIIHQAHEVDAAHAAVDAVVDGKAHFLMKGLINTADFLRAVLRSERGLKTGNLLSHLGAFEIPGFSRLIYITDGGMNIAPDLEQKWNILKRSIEYLQHLGMEQVNTVVLAANEVANPKMTATIDALALVERARAEDFPGAIVEGPLALDCAFSSMALKHKGINSQIKGETDLVLVPTIEVGNALAKSIVYFAGGVMAGIILGAKVPIVLTSRNDSPRSKLLSILMAAL